MDEQSGDENDDTDLDPRIQIELEKLNSATDEINSLEVELDEANTTFRILLNESTRRLKLLSKKLGGCIERARPYYDALELAKQAQMECQRAAVQYQRANEIHQAAKETVALAEQRFLSKQHEWQFDNAWQEMLNHATIKVMEAETQKTESGLEHQKRALLFNQAEQKLQALESKLRRNINKSRPYFEEKELCQSQLATQKERVEFLQKKVASVKHSYAMSLKELERISEEIHLKRGDLGRGVREPGVGAENDAITEMDLEKLNETLKNTQYSEPKILSSKFAKIINPVSEFSEEETNKNCIDRYLPSLDVSKLKTSTSSNYSDLDYELELDRCDLQSLGSVSIATSSAVSDEDCIEDDSEMEELKQMAAKLSNNKTDLNDRDIIVNGCEDKRTQDLLVRKVSSDTFDNVRRFSENWERQMSETINKLGTILNLKQKDPGVCCSETKEKY